MMKIHSSLVAILSLSFLCLPSNVVGQQVVNNDNTNNPSINSLLLTVDSKKLFLESAWGRRVIQELEDNGRTLQHENENLIATMSKREAEINELRRTGDEENFLKEANAFDEWANSTRRERAELDDQRLAKAASEESRFFQEALPTIQSMMNTYEASVIIEKNSALISEESIDITDELVAELDSVLGDGKEEK